MGQSATASVAIAVSSLSYNTWRNEKTEHNRNQRQASFEVLIKLGELQELVFYGHYDQDLKLRGNPRSGWALVLTIRDLSQVLEHPLPESSELLVDVWDRHWNDLGKAQASADAILNAIEKQRNEALKLIRNLD
jgi:hypothetical protein